MKISTHWIISFKPKKNAALWLQSGPHCFIFHHILYILVLCNCQLKMTPSTAAPEAGVSKPLPATCVYKGSLEHSHSRSFTCCLWLLSCHHGKDEWLWHSKWPTKPKILFGRKIFLIPVLENERTATGLMLGVGKEQLPASVTTVIKFSICD